MVYIHDFGTMTHTHGIGNFSAKTIKLRFLVLLAILSNHKIHHIYLNLAVLLTCMMYYMRLCNVEYYQGYIPLIFLRVHDMYPLGQNVEGTIFRWYMDPRKFRQLSILKAQSRLRFSMNC